MTVRGTFFWSEIADPVANVTLSSTQALITRQRQNLGATRARGAELSAEMHLPRHLLLSGEYIFTDSTVISFPGANSLNPSLVGLQVPEVPRNSFNVQLSYAANKWTAGIQSRWIGNAFDDDQNLLPLGRAYVVDAEVSRELFRHVTAFWAAQNLFNDSYNIARTPTPNTGPPILVRGGFRFNLN